MLDLVQNAVFSARSHAMYQNTRRVLGQQVSLHKLYFFSNNAVGRACLTAISVSIVTTGKSSREVTVSSERHPERSIVSRQAVRARYCSITIDRRLKIGDKTGNYQRDESTLNAISGVPFREAEQRTPRVRAPIALFATSAAD